MKTKNLIPSLLVVGAFALSAQNSGYSAPPASTTPPPGTSPQTPAAPAPQNGNPNINGPAPGNYINSTNVPPGTGQPYNMGASNWNPNINGPVPGASNAPNHFYQPNLGNTNFGSYPGGAGGSNTQTWIEYTNPNGTVTYNTNVPNWWEKR
jgi:hypothetical protein